MSCFLLRRGDVTANCVKSYVVCLLVDFGDNEKYCEWIAYLSRPVVLSEKKIKHIRIEEF